MPNEPELTRRRAAILAAVVEEHVKTAAPVGSKVVQEKHGVDASTATIRNEMCVLERRGFIEQPHTSAGRIPADKGYRTYVDALMGRRSPSADEMAWVRAQYRRVADRTHEAIYRTTSAVLSQLTSAPAMVMAAPPGQSIMTAIKLTPVSSQVIVFSYETSTSGAHQCLVNSPEPLTAEQVAALSQALERHCVGRAAGALTICRPQTIEEEMAPHAVPVALLDEIKLAVEQDRGEQVYVDGAAYALNYPEFQTMERLRPVMEALDEDKTVRRLLRPATRRGRMTVTIGREQNIGALKQSSVIARHYEGPGGDAGALGIIGPTRIDYQAVIAIVDCVAEHVAQAFSKLSRAEE